MGENTAISWADHTFNPWIGCTKVSAGCKNCYAAAQDKFRSWTPEGWGAGKPRKLTSEANWQKPLQWNRQAEREGVRYRVFCASLADVFDSEVSDVWRDDLFFLIDSTPDLDSLECVPCLVVGETQHSYVIEIETPNGDIVKRHIAKENFIPEVPA